MELIAVLIGLTLILVPFVMPIVSWVMARRVRDRVGTLEQLLSLQQDEIRALTTRLSRLEKAPPRETRPAAAPVPATVSAPAPAVAQPVDDDRPAARVIQPEPTPEREAEPELRPAPKPEDVPAAEPVAPEPKTIPPRPVFAPPPVPAPVPAIAPELKRPASAEPRGIRGTRMETDAESVAASVAIDAGEASAVGGARAPLPPVPPGPPIPPEPEPAPEPLFKLPAIDLEQLVGVRLFSAIAGIALVFAGVLFLRYSIEHGWLQPPVRVIIGTLTGIGLLVVCELKAARRYPVTANALDAAAIALLFATFFSAHALWNLISQAVTFGLLALVTAVAVMLSIRRESLFIAVLGLLGGFATPVMLSSGENRPISLFSYLLLLNIGLAWVAHRQRWPILTALTLVFTTLYQWGWVFRFLDASQLPLAAGIFIVFAIVGFAGLILSTSRADADAEESPFPRMGLIAAVMPLLFAVYLAAVPAYRDNFWLLFGFLVLVDVGLFAITVARKETLLHVAGAALTLVVFAVWLGVSYSGGAWPAILGITSAFVLFYLFAPEIAERFGAPLDEPADKTIFVAPILLFVPATLVRIEPAADSPLLLFGVLLALLLVIAWRAAARQFGLAYFVAAFMAFATEAMWSATHLRMERIAEAIGLYAIFGVIYISIPILARRFGRALQPDGAAGAVVLASLILLFNLSSGPTTPAVMWGLALLLAILNAGLFVESAATRLPILSLIASGISWGVLAHWWTRAGAAIGVMPSLLVLVGLMLLMVAGYSWSRQQVSDREDEAATGFRYGFYLALVGHLFLFAVVLDLRWSIPPWPLFGALTVMTLALVATALAFRDGPLHAATMIAAAMVMFGFATVANSSPWSSVAIGAIAAMSAFALASIALTRQGGYEGLAGAAAAVTLVIGVFSAITTLGHPQPPPFWLLLAWFTVAHVVLLVLSTRYGWPYASSAAAVLAGLVMMAWQGQHQEPAEWSNLLLMTGAMFAPFAAYPLLLGGRAKSSRDPYIAPIVASVWAFFAARHAFETGGLGNVVGIVPVALGAVMALHLYQLLRLQPPGERDLGRLALVAAVGLAFVTVAIPLQLEEQWITIGWALEGAALAWLYGRIPHRGLFFWSGALLAAVFVRLVLNPEVFLYEPRGAMRVINWYLYTYVLAAGSMFVATWCLAQTDDEIMPRLPRLSYVTAGAGTILLFVLLNIEIADYYATGPAIVFRFGVSIAQDLTYTIGWLFFGLAMLTVGIGITSRSARLAAIALIAVTTLKCFLYDLRSLEGLYRIGAFLGLFISLTLVSLALQKYVLKQQRQPA